MKRLISAIVLVLAIVGPAWALSVDLRIEWELPTHFAVSDTDCSDGETVIPAADLAALVSTVEYRIGGGPVQVATTSARFIEVAGVVVEDGVDRHQHRLGRVGRRVYLEPVFVENRDYG